MGATSAFTAFRVGVQVKVKEALSRAHQKAESLGRLPAIASQAGSLELESRK